MRGKDKTVRLFSLMSLGYVLMSFAVIAEAVEGDPATEALFRKAHYWHDKSHNDLAEESLRKVLLINPQDRQALFLLSLWSGQAGNSRDADKWREQLAAIAPDDPGLQTLNDVREVRRLPQGQLSLARQQARSGNISASLATWRSLFRGDVPPVGIAAEYYLTMGGDKALYPQAVAGLRESLSQNPQDTSVRIALAKLLTYQDSSRREGISMLQSVATGNPDADSALRQALLWLSPQPGDEALYQEWMQRHPQDNAVLSYWHQGEENAAREQGYTLLNKGDLSGARQDFAEVLKTNPQDADALAGMGYVSQRAGDFAAAAEYLERAARLGGNNAADRQEQARDAAFYARLALAQEAMKQGDTQKALALSAPLSLESGSRGSAASLFRADVLRRSHQYQQAESVLRDLLTKQPDNVQASENLYYVLLDGKKTAEASELLHTLPVSVQAQLRKSASGGGGTPDAGIRKAVASALQRGDQAGAEKLLRQGLVRIPGDPWLSLDLARLLQKQGNHDAAMRIMAPFFHGDSRKDALYAAALYSVDNQAWQQARTLMERIAVNQQDSGMKNLLKRINFNLQMASARQLIEQGNSAAALRALQAARSFGVDNPADAGQLARLLVNEGDLTDAVQVVRDNMKKGVQGNAGDYADQLAVLNEAGLSREAASWLNNPALQARSTPQQLAGLRDGYTVNEADRLRLQGNYAAAWDLLTRALQQTPADQGLIAAMARLYESGKMPGEAARIYDWLMAHDTASQDGRVGAINLALAQNDTERAKLLAAGLRDKNAPDRLILLARLEEQAGARQQALSYLREARGKLLGLQTGGLSTSPEIGGLVMADNPFAGMTQRDGVSSGASLYGTVLPWQVSSAGQDPQTSLPGTVRTDLPVESARVNSLRQIDDLMDRLDDETETWYKVGTEVRSRDGESGLSKLTVAEAPLTWSTVPLGDSRLEMTVTPLTLSAGAASGDAARRQGSGATGNAVQSLVNTLNTMQQSVKTMNETEQAAFFAANPEMNALRSRIFSDVPLATFSGLSPFTDEGRKNLASLNANPALMRYLTNSPYKPSSSADNPATGQDLNTSGVALNMSLSGESYKADIGTTPLAGGEQGSLVGGVSWFPKITQYLSLQLTGEHRAVTDSFLSWMGARDPLSGERWGRVTRSGGSAQLSYDDGDAGYYIGAGRYYLRGENVADNRSMEASAGVYIRPWKDAWRQLQMGISTSWMDYDKNLSYFSFGHGGYFSPTNYVSVSLPVDYSLKKDNWLLNLGGAVGYQSYSQGSSPYYPTRPEWQGMLDLMADEGFTRESRYKGNTQNGVGYSFHGGLDYRINRAMTISGNVGYDTFGDYSETTAGLGFRYIPGGN